MAYKRSNIYASRVFAEHPITTWALDEDYGFASFLSSAEKDISTSNWILTNASKGINIDASITYKAPLVDENFSKIYLSSTTNQDISISLNSPIIYSSEIDEEKQTIAISASFYTESVFISYITIGFEINGKDYYKKYNIAGTDIAKWINLSFTKKAIRPFNIIPKIIVSYKSTLPTLINPATESNRTDTAFIINGISVGQWSEEFATINTGASEDSFEPALNDFALGSFTSQTKYIPLLPYGLNSDDIAYGIKFKNKMLFENSGMPLVFGSNNSLSIFATKDAPYFTQYFDLGLYNTSEFDESYDLGGVETIAVDVIDGGDPYTVLNEALVPIIPSLIFPGKGFLNNLGKGKELSIEFWMRLNNESSKLVRIFGPTSNDDGLYVSGDKIVFKIGKFIKSYFISQWYRPMLINICQTSSEIYLMINGEKVIKIDATADDLDSLSLVENDFLGVYTNEKISIFDFDCMSTYPYAISEQLAKIRFVYAQGVEEQDRIVESFDGEVTSVDFVNAGYNSSATYPDKFSWNSGFSNNLKVGTDGISLPQKNIPKIIFTQSSGLSLTENQISSLETIFKEKNFNIQDEDNTYISMNPDNYFDDYSTSIYFSNMNQSGEETKSLFGVFKTGSNITTKQNVIKFYDINNNIFDINIESSKVKYLYNDELLFEQSVAADSYFNAGIDINKISEEFESTLLGFFLNQDLISISIGGSSNRFLGKIFRVTFNNEFLNEKDYNLIFSGSFARSGFLNSIDYSGTYTIIPTASNKTIFLDVAAVGYWETNIPLSYFGKYVTDKLGSKFYDLDILQFNLDAPGPSLFSEDTISSSYQEVLSSEAYITLQYIGTVGSLPFKEYSSIVDKSHEKILNFNTVNDIDTTAYRITNGTVIIPPKGTVDFKDYSISIHIFLKSNGTSTENIKIKKMSINSSAFDESGFHEIKTRNINSVYPIVKNEEQYVYDQPSPVLINHETSPYLYITGNSGVSAIPYNEDGLARRLSFPINTGKQDKYEIAGLQIFAMYNKSRLFNKTNLLGKIISQAKSFDILLIPEESGKRAYLKTVDSNTGKEVIGLKYFINGRAVNTLYIKPLVWNVIGISFEYNLINTSEQISQLEIENGILVNNVSIYKKSDKTSFTIALGNIWSDIYRSAISGEVYQWEDYLTPILQKWGADILKSQTQPGSSLDGVGIYNAYTGLSNIIIDDSSTMMVKTNSITVTNDNIWDKYQVSAL